MYGCPRPIVTAFIPVGNECSSWRNEDSCYGRYQADPYVAKIKYWQGLKVPPDLEYCDGLLDRKVPFWLYHKYLLYTRLDQAYSTSNCSMGGGQKKDEPVTLKPRFTEVIDQMFNVYSAFIPFSHYPISSWILSSCVKSNHSIMSIVSNCVNS